MHNIILTTAISGKAFIISAFLDGVKLVLQANPSMRWLVCDTSGSESIKKSIHLCAKDSNCDFTYSTFPCGPKYDDYAKRDGLKALIEYMPSLYNHMMSHVPECNFVLNIEDDIVPEMANPVPALLKGFDGDTAAVVGVTFNRRLTTNFGILQGNLKDTKREGYSEIKRTAFGLIMMKFEYSQMGFSNSLGTDRAFDNVFGAKVESFGKTMRIAWNVRARHYFKAKDGAVCYVG